MIRFWKTETIGNDFVLIDLREVRPNQLGALAKRVSDRHFGIGSDGLLAVAPHESGLELRMFNPDGTEDFCGNGLRCAAAFGRGQGWTPSEFSIQHGGRLVPASVGPDGDATVVLPPADYRPVAVPIATQTPAIDLELHGVVGSALSTGSTHFVVFCEDLPLDEEFFRVSPRIEHDPIFPERTSVMYVKVGDDRHLRLRIWERGAGETLGCGTGSVAAAVEWARRSGSSGTFLIENPGGELEVVLPHWDAPITSRSRPKVTFTGAIPCDASVLARPGNQVTLL
ncbi:MAG: diaminopimelate epimerase [Armatimonadetes bacterium]|nr:diaminopimelate epimerase [Armatimonadota bacterium]